jgi:hypothetical protein
MIVVRSEAYFYLVPFAGHIHRYNSLEGQPDILRSLYSALQPSNTFEDRRYNCNRHNNCKVFSCDQTNFYIWTFDKCQIYSSRNTLFMCFAVYFLTLE